MNVGLRDPQSSGSSVPHSSKNVYTSFRYEPTAIGFAPLTTNVTLLHNKRMPVTSEEATINGTTSSSSRGAQLTGRVDVQQRGVWWGVLGLGAMLGLALAL